MKKLTQSVVTMDFEKIFQNAETAKKTELCNEESLIIMPLDRHFYMKSIILLENLLF